MLRDVVFVVLYAIQPVVWGQLSRANDGCAIALVGTATSGQGVQNELWSAIALVGTIYAVWDAVMVDPDMPAASCRRRPAVDVPYSSGTYIDRRVIAAGVNP